jgi:hypothetical protein
VVGGILEFAGIDGFLTNRAELWEAMDTEGPRWAAFLAALLAELENHTFLSTDVKALATGPDRDGVLQGCMDGGWILAHYEDLMRIFG